MAENKNVATETVAPKTYLDRVVTLESLEARALLDPSFANSFNGIETLQAGQILTFPTIIPITEKFFNDKPYNSVVTVDGKEIAFSQFTRNDYAGTPINPKFSGLGFATIIALLSGKTAMVQKTIVNMPTYVEVKGKRVRSIEASSLCAPKSVNYFVIAGVQEALLAD